MDVLYNSIMDSWKKIQDESNYTLNKKENIELWNQSANYYDDTMGSDLARIDACINALKSHNLLSKDLVLADIGCATGCISIPVSHMVKQVIAIDSSPKMLEILDSKKIPNITTKQASLSEIKNEKYDVILASYVPTTYNEESILQLAKMATYGGLFAVNSGTNQNSLSSKIFGNINRSNGMDIIFPFNILYLNGLKPHIHYIDSKYSITRDSYGYINQTIKFYSQKENLPNNYQDIITKHILCKSKDGVYTDICQYTTGIVTWKCH